MTKYEIYSITISFPSSLSFSISPEAASRSLSMLYVPLVFSYGVLWYLRSLMVYLYTIHCPRMRTMEDDIRIFVTIHSRSEVCGGGDVNSNMMNMEMAATWPRP